MASLVRKAQIVPYGMKLLNPPEKDGKPGV
jgi:hypothetical protein